ncbi:terminase gpA endonuclease subunit [Lysinibacillus sp. NPDC047702]|uniref:terminase gpA endonuclease subunit n=1 Tax=unclassified Lysinibacillus TaxID=2636778 RepID=UPI003D00B92F
MESGTPYQVWVKILARNERFDLRVYKTAAIEIVNPNFEREYSIGTISTVKRQKRRKRDIRK